MPDGNDAVYVAPTGSDQNPGTSSAPMRTINAAVAAAEAAGVEVADGVAIFGGFDPISWARAPNAVTRIEGSPQAVHADGSTGVTLDGLLLRATAPGPGKSAYGIRAVNGSSLELVDVDVGAASGA